MSVNGAKKLNFTDGTFLIMLDSDGDPGQRVYASGKKWTFTIPNLYWGNIDNSIHSYTKYDYDGNKYVFTQNGVEINDDLTLGDDTKRWFFTHNESTGKMQARGVTPIYLGLPARLNHDTGWKFMMFISYNGNTTPIYNSFGEALAEGEGFFDAYTPGTGDGRCWYQLENIVERVIDSPFAGTTVFMGYHDRTINTINVPIWNSMSTSEELDIDISNSIEDFDPVIPDEPDSDDPYDPAGNSDTGGGTGDFDGSSDDVDFPDLPTLSATDTGFITLFNPSISQLQSLASYMWGTLFDEGSFKKLFADPMNCILGLSIVPVNVPSGSAKVVKVGNISTNVSITVATSQYVEVDCGTLNVNEYWGSYIDYAPYTKADIYLPYIGTHAIDVDDIMNKAVHVKYHVDVLSGACTAYVKCGDSIIYSFIGQCASSIPITGNDWTNVINGVLSITGSIGTMVATGGATAPMTLQQIASTSVNSMKPEVEKSGALSGTGGLLGVQKPYIILTRPRQALPSSQNSFMGYPSFITEYLGSLSGYTEIESVHLDGIPANDAEITEIENLLKGGVIF